VSFGTAAQGVYFLWIIGIARHIRRWTSDALCKAEEEETCGTD